MIRFMRISCCSLILVVVLLSACSDKIIRYERQEDKIKPLRTKVKTLILHDDYIVAENQSKAFKDFVIKRIVEKIKGNSKFQLIHLKKGSPLPDGNDFKGRIVIVGNIWSRSGSTSGEEVALVRKTKSTKNQRQSWDELERRHWKQDLLQTIISLNFIEITDKTRLLRGVITISNDRHYQLSDNKRKIKDSQFSDLFAVPKLSPGYDHIIIKSTFNKLDTALNSLAQASVNKSFESL